MSDTKSSNSTDTFLDVLVKAILITPQELVMTDMHEFTSAFINLALKTIEQFGPIDTIELSYKFNELLIKLFANDYENFEKLDNFTPFLHLVLIALPHENKNCFSNITFGHNDPRDNQMN